MEPKISLEMSLGDIGARYPQIREALEQLGLDYCCGGKQSLGQAAAQAGHDPGAIQAKLTEIAERTPRTEKTDFPALSATELVEHIESTHHVFMRRQLPRLTSLLEKVQRVHKQHHGAMLEVLAQTFGILKADIELHLDKEEQILFPYIRQIEAFAQQQGPLPQMHCGTVQNPINQMEYEHDEAGAALSKMREVTDNYRLPDDGCETFKALYDGLADLEQDLHQHIHLENNILFPKAVRLEQSITQNQH
jgi:regulator of cell morphogenesis and NO signaling